jgi:gluconokinase
VIIVVEGVAGSGKTTVGQLLAAQLDYLFLEGDSLHSARNIEKMTRGIPLTDDDRAPWLVAIHACIVESYRIHQGVVVTCSALKERYRKALADGVSITWVYLKGSEELLRARLQRRQNHFFKVQMLASQFADLEEPTDAIVIDITLAPDAAVRQIVNALNLAQAKVS